MPQLRILLVEDDPTLAMIAQEGLESLGYEVVGPYNSGEELIANFGKIDPQPDLALMDINLAGAMDGIETARILSRDFGLSVIYASALSDGPTLERATQAEPFGYIVKPYQLNELRAALEIGLHKKQRDLERKEILERTVGGSIEMLTEILSVVEPQGLGRGQKLKEHALTLGEAMAIPSLWELGAAAALSQIGYVLIPAQTMQKQRAGVPLTAVEHSLIERCPEYGSDLLKRIPRLENIARVVLYQNKHFDGTGFPKDDVAGDEIPDGSRILKVLADFLKLAAAGLPKARIIHELKAAKGVYDPQILNAAILAVIDAPPKGAQAVKVEELKIGQVLKAAIETIDGTLLVASETSITAMLQKRLLNFMQVSGIKEPVYVHKSEEP